MKATTSVALMVSRKSAATSAQHVNPTWLARRHAGKGGVGAAYSIRPDCCVRYENFLAAWILSGGVAREGYWKKRSTSVISSVRR